MTKILSKEIAFNGKLRTNVDGAAVGPNDFQVLQNLRPTETGIRAVAGQTKINSTAAITGVNGIHFRKSQPSESHVVIEGSNYKPYQNTVAIPGTGDYSATPLYDTVGVQAGRYAIAPTGMLARCSGDKSLLYGGTAYRCSAFIDLPVAGSVYDYSEQVVNTLTSADQLATIHTYGGGPYVATFYILSILPASGFNLVMQTVNPYASTMAAYYWNGSAWASVSTLSDGTSGLTASGSVTFDSTASLAKQTAIEKQVGFWTKVTVSSASNFNGTPKISNCTVVIPMQPVQDIWDGDMIPAAAFVVNQNGTSNTNQDLTANVLDPYMGIYSVETQTYATININNDGYLLLGFQDPVRAIAISIDASHYNLATSTLDYLAYWNGAAWVDIASTVIDGTKDATVTMNKSGWVTWEPPADNTEKPQTGLPGHDKLASGISGKLETVSKDFPLYYYKIGFSLAMTATTTVYHIGGVRAPKTIKGCSFPVQHSNRLFLCDFLNEDRNAAMYSSAGSANIFNGKDSDKIFFGGDEALISGASIYNRFGSTEASLFIACKAGETWVLSGDDPEKWTKFRISDTIGCVAPLTMHSINVPSKDMTPGVSSNAAIWLSQRGVVLFSGGSFTYISDDIGDLFDSQRSTYLGDAVLATCTGFIDPKRNEYHLVVPGVAEYAYSFLYGKWFQIVRGTALNGGLPVQDTNGISHIYGYGPSYLYRLENGNDFDGTDIAIVWQTGDFALPDGSIMEKSRIDWGRLIAKAKTVTDQNVTVTYYDDTGSSAFTTKTVSPINSGYRLMNAKLHKLDKQSTFHSLKFSISTDDETIGFEPMFVGLRYTVFPDEVS